MIKFVNHLPAFTTFLLCWLCPLFWMQPAVFGKDIAISLQNVIGTAYEGDEKVVGVLITGTVDQERLIIPQEMKDQGVYQVGGVQKYNFSRIINGNYSTHSQILLRIGVRKDRPQVVQVQGIAVELDGKRFAVPTFTAEFVPIPAQDTLTLEYTAKPQQTYPGQAVYTSLQFSFDQDISIEKARLPLLETGYPVKTAQSRYRGTANTRIPFASPSGGQEIPFELIEANIHTNHRRYAAHLLFFPEQSMDMQPFLIKARVITGREYRKDFFGRAVEVPIYKSILAKSNTARVEVLPFPQPQPADFSNAVGNFTLTSEVIGSGYSTGDRIPLRITIRGKNYNFSKLKDPTQGIFQRLGDKLALPPSYSGARERIIQQKIEQNSITYDLTLLAKTAGEAQIPAVRLSYFDPSSKIYKTAESNPISLNIGQAEVFQIDQIVDSAPAIVPTEPDSSSLYPLDSLLVPHRDTISTEVMLLGVLFPPILYCGLFFLRRQGLHPERLRKTKAKQLVQDSMQKLLAQESAPELEAKRLMGVLQDYLQHRYATAKSGLTAQDVLPVLGGVCSSDSLHNLQALLSEYEEICFSPQGILTPEKIGLFKASIEQFLLKEGSGV